MDAHKLLELAAKAIGEEFHSNHITVGGQQFEWIEWNPLVDDGDALRLAVTLRIGIDWERSACVDRLACPKWYAVANQYGDANACTRMAIVRAAAQIGREMP